MIAIEPRDQVAVLRFVHEQNLFDREFVSAASRALDDIESSDAVALVTTGDAKFYTNGFDLPFLASLEPESLEQFVRESRALLARVLTFPMPTVAAVNGHAFGIGAMLALAHDLRVMRRDRGWFCLPEIDLGLRFHPFMAALITTKLSEAAASEAVLTGRRYTGAEAVDAGIAHKSADEPDVLDVAVAMAVARAGKARDVTMGLKQDLYRAALASLG